MKKSIKLLFTGIILLTSFLSAYTQTVYGDYKSFSARIEKLSQQNSGLCSVDILAKTAGGKNIYVISIGTGDRDKKPAIAVLGGIEGNYLAGREIALGFAEKILKDSGNPEIKALLGKLTFYIMPDMSPDAAEQYFTGLRYERALNSRNTDDDRDFRNGEDPFEDLNDDGIISLVRINDPAGTFTQSDEDKRVMVAADLSKGEKGNYIVISEGTDNDGDGQFNEDGPGGVVFNRNFTFNYEEYGPNAGMHAVSEPESKALADFLYDHFNIYMTIAFGPQDNLGQPMKASERQSVSGQGMTPGSGRGQGMNMEAGDRRITAITKSDEAINKLLSEKYHEITGMKGSPPAKNTPGNFMEWAYFHYGRYSFSTPAWWIQPDKLKNQEAAFLKYAEKKGIKDAFIEWTEIKHPDFPGKKAEVGGLRPFAMLVPPVDTLEHIISANYKYITEISRLHPELEFLDVKLENAGENIYRISLKVHNKGIFATCAESGNNNMWTKIMRLSVEPSPGQTILSGQKVQRIRRLEGDEALEFSWLISGKGSTRITAGAINTGTINTSLDLK